MNVGIMIYESRHFGNPPERSEGTDDERKALKAGAHRIYTFIHCHKVIYTWVVIR